MDASRLLNILHNIIYNKVNLFNLLSIRIILEKILRSKCDIGVVGSVVGLRIAFDSPGELSKIALSVTLPL